MYIYIYRYVYVYIVPARFLRWIGLRFSQLVQPCEVPHRQRDGTREVIQREVPTPTPTKSTRDMKIRTR